MAFLMVKKVDKPTILKRSELINTETLIKSENQSTIW